MSLNIDWETISTAELNDLFLKKYLLMALNNFTGSASLFFILEKANILTWRSRLLIAVSFLIVTYVLVKLFF